MGIFLLIGFNSSSAGVPKNTCKIWIIFENLSRNLVLFRTEVISDLLEVVLRIALVKI